MAAAGPSVLWKKQKAGRVRRVDGRPAGQGVKQAAPDVRPRPPALRAEVGGAQRRREAGRAGLPRIPGTPGPAPRPRPHRQVRARTAAGRARPRGPSPSFRGSPARRHAPTDRVGPTSGLCRPTWPNGGVFRLPALVLLQVTEKTPTPCAPPALPPRPHFRDV
ncbi:PREDICTED: translation initiation factor IF-2-like [Chinchilla lanigera]|uniref:translation initiation factor IF-2-like n=1 Tax=Chinchilla lanigera TaxID=34839 RepID=UPI00069683A2|nr:PREDICTED: translation initiation factor IF-2-like [Chinchilla lanigera]